MHIQAVYICILFTLSLHSTFGQVDIAFYPVAGGFVDPVIIVNAGDGSNRLFIGEQRGVIKILHPGTGEVLGEAFLDIQSLVKAGGEEGLLGIAFHPDFPDTPYFYVQYTFDPGAGPDRNRISRFTLSADVNKAIPNSELVVMDVVQPESNHNGGDIHFGQDDYLYVALGDGGGQFDPDSLSQNPMSLLGKILRIDVDMDDFPLDSLMNYSIPPSNPYIGNAAYLGEIWALGLRNPWRISFDPIYHDLYIGDVGQNNWEEINFQAAASPGGENYGWNCKEGTSSPGYGPCLPGPLTDPIFEYAHTEGCSVTGGYVYRGNSFPSLQGQYLCIDYCTAKLWVMDSTASVVQSFDLSGVGNIATFGISESFELYASNIRSGNDMIYRVFDKSICPDTLTVDTVSESLYLAEHGLSSTAVISIPGPVNFAAGDSIVLETSFQVDATSVLSVWAQSCTNYILQNHP